MQMIRQTFFKALCAGPTKREGLRSLARRVRFVQIFLASFFAAMAKNEVPAAVRLKAGGSEQSPVNYSDFSK